MKINWTPSNRFVVRLVFLWVLFSLPLPVVADQENPPLKNDEPSVSSSAPVKPESYAGWMRVDGEGIIDAPIHIVALFFKDVNKAKEMIPGLHTKTILRKISETKRIDYDHYKLIWPFKDRYLIYHVEQAYDTGQKILYTLNSTESFPHEDKDKILGTIRESSFLLQSLSETPSKTRITVSLRINPNGWLPVWLLNMHTKTWANKLIRNLQEDIQRYLASQAS